MKKKIQKIWQTLSSWVKTKLPIVVKNQKKRLGVMSTKVFRWSKLQVLLGGRKLKKKFNANPAKLFNWLKLGALLGVIFLIIHYIASKIPEDKAVKKAGSTNWWGGNSHWFWQIPLVILVIFLIGLLIKWQWKNISDWWSKKKWSGKEIWLWILILTGLIFIYFAFQKVTELRMGTISAWQFVTSYEALGLGIALAIVGYFLLNHGKPMPPIHEIAGKIAIGFAAVLIVKIWIWPMLAFNSPIQFLFDQKSGELNLSSKELLFFVGGLIILVLFLRSKNKGVVLGWLLAFVLVGSIVWKVMAWQSAPQTFEQLSTAVPMLSGENRVRLFLSERPVKVEWINGMHHQRIQKPSGSKIRVWLSENEPSDDSGSEVYSQEVSGEIDPFSTSYQDIPMWVRLEESRGGETNQVVIIQRL